MLTTAITTSKITMKKVVAKYAILYMSFYCQFVSMGKNRIKTVYIGLSCQSNVLSKCLFVFALCKVLKELGDVYLLEDYKKKRN